MLLVPLLYFQNHGRAPLSKYLMRSQLSLNLLHFNAFNAKNTLFQLFDKRLLKQDLNRLRQVKRLQFQLLQKQYQHQKLYKQQDYHHSSKSEVSEPAPNVKVPAPPVNPSTSLKVNLLL